MMMTLSSRWINSTAMGGGLGGSGGSMDQAIGLSSTQWEGRNKALEEQKMASMGHGHVYTNAYQDR